MNFSFSLKKALLIGFFCVYSFLGYAQTILVGTAIDSTTNKGIDYLQIELYQLPSKKLLDYTYTKSDGSFKLFIEQEGVFELRTRSFNYAPTSTQLVLLSAKDSIKIHLLLQPKSTKLDEVEVIAKRPGVVYKQDTVIYDVATWIKEDDANLESVLARMPGLKINPDGSVEFEKKIVQHILINGNKVTDVGAAIITKNLQANQVATI